MKYTVIYNSGDTWTWASQPIEWHYNWLSYHTFEELSSLRISTPPASTPAEIQFAADLNAIVQSRLTRLNPKGN